MTNKIILFALLFAMPLWTKPKGQSTVVGCLIVEVVGSYPKEQGPVYKKHDIRVDCEYVNKKGKTRQYSFMTRVDEDGYYKLDKVPAGEYVLKAVEFTFERTGRITLASKFGRADFSDDARYWGMIPGMMMDNATDLQQDQIEVESREGIIDLGITYIQITANEQATETGMPLVSPDGRPPWQRISVKERGSIIDLHISASATLTELKDKPLVADGTRYTKMSPTVYFGLE